MNLLTLKTLSQVLAIAELAKWQRKIESSKLHPANIYTGKTKTFKKNKRRGL